MNIFTQIATIIITNHSFSYVKKIVKRKLHQTLLSRLLNINYLRNYYIRINIHFNQMQKQQSKTQRYIM